MLNKYSNTITRFAIALLCTGALFGCKKKDPIEITVTGTVTDLKLGGPVGGAVVTLKVREIVNGTYSNSFTTIESATTNSSGNYSFTFENRTASDYKLVVVIDNYFSFEEIKNPESLSTSQSNTWNAGVYPMAWYKVNLVNGNPYDEFDEILYQNMSGTNTCAGCCNSNQEIFVGDAVNETLECVLHGETWLKFQWVVTRAGAPNSVDVDSVFCTAFDTTEYNLVY